MTGILADIHGNAWALEAVLRDAARRGVVEFVDLGDVLYGPLAPRRTYELLRGVNLVAQVKGNQDRFIVDGAPANPTLDFVRADLGPEPVAWLASLPAGTVFGDWLLCHGSPASDTAYLLEDVSTGHPRVRGESEIRALLGDETARWILCGHTHVARLVSLASTGQTILNPGSVGLPAYDDDAPVPHFMESFSPHACYATVDRGVVSFHRVPYDWGAAAARARELGREDWARGIAAGRM
jgi:diadenosine tetraphosphatase ApaH/serine/threonine PP2A family protein phosphatase